MGFSFRIDASQRLAVIHATGSISMEDFQALAAGLRTDPAFGPTMRQLVLMDISHSTIGYREWQAARVQMASGPRGRRIAIVAKTDYAFAVARQYEHSYGAADQDVMVFRDEAEAAAWLGVKMDTPME